MKTTTPKTEKRVARIFADVGGYFVCDEESEFLDARGTAYPNKRAAQRAAVEAGYTHGVGSGMTRDGKLDQSLSDYRYPSVEVLSGPIRTSND